ncbi:MAG: hypothetical protein LAN37_09025 [Acidobacteriia bacterium]|nr:hypothetical protein [Terriglobia bacterium]
MSTRTRKRKRIFPAAGTKATQADADVILYLYDLRRDDEMRKARHFVSAEFWPETADDVLRVIRAYPSRENTWLRQVISYWEMAAAFVLRGALHEQLFFDCTGEMYCVFSKFQPFLKELRPKLPFFLLTVEEVIMRLPEGRARLARIQRRLERRKQKLEARKAIYGAASAGYT